ncbi:hypothetical protein K7T73_08520 [Bacillus badius]|uniref:hypothetical protein n=1 Tax=Bacillus badius TaxID=1455 RepID=UPI001CBA714F|nr:hypothetical protein [Bacillus badius]UAT32236.1 hypothetical protein K7T73_08520 [Bacillus badius]
MFIKVYNSFITIDSDKKLTINELSIYCYLYTLRTHEEVVLTSYDILSADNVFYKNQTTNKKEIKKCIDSLKEKSIISVSEKNKLLEITFLFKEKGHVQITYEKFRSFNKPRDLYIYTAVKKWEKLGGAKYSNNNWADLLLVTREHAIKVIEDACQRGIIYKKTGTYTESMINNRNQKLQERNIYSIKPFENEIFEVDESENTFGLEEETAIIPSDLNINEELHNWNNDKDLIVNDFVFYLKNIGDKEIREMCEKKLNRISNKNKKFEFVKKKLMNEAEETIALEEKKEKEKDNREYECMIKSMIEQTNDVVLKVDGQLIGYQDFLGIGIVEEVYYLQKVDVSDQVGEDDAFIVELRVKHKPKDVEVYRKLNG